MDLPYTAKVGQEVTNIAAVNASIDAMPIGQRREPLHRGDSGSGLGAAEHPAQGGAQAHQAGVH